MATITFTQYGNGAQGPPNPENYTQVSGIYSLQIAPQFLSAIDNVQYPPIELMALEQAYTQREDLRFFRMR